MPCCKVRLIPGSNTVLRGGGSLGIEGLCSREPIANERDRGYATPTTWRSTCLHGLGQGQLGVGAGHEIELRDAAV